MLDDVTPPRWTPMGVFFGLFAAMLVARGWVDDRAYLALCGPALLVGPARRWVALLALAHYLNPTNGQLSRSPLVSANHEYLEALLLVVIAIEPARDAVGQLRLAHALRGIAIALVFIPGVQKLAHGAYPRGDFFTLGYAERSKFARALDTLTTDAERKEAEAFRAALVAFREETREGLFERVPPRPWIVTATSWVLCWATLAAELVLPWLLLARRARTRRWGAAALIAFFLGVEMIALEWMFGGWVACLLVPLLLERDDPVAPAPPGTATWLLRAVLVVLWTWPCAHLYLAFAHDLSPWKLGGLGMYAIPAREGIEWVEVRAPGDAAWRARPPRDLIERRRYEYAGYVLRNVPFASGVAEGLVAPVRAAEPPGAPPMAVRIGVTTVRWDRTCDRYRVTQRIWTHE